jgi:hypothetical protein
VIGHDAASLVTISPHSGLSVEPMSLDRHCPQWVESRHSANGRIGWKRITAIIGFGCRPRLYVMVGRISTRMSPAARDLVSSSQKP